MFHATLTSAIIPLPQNPGIEFISNHSNTSRESRAHSKTVIPRNKFFLKFSTNSPRITSRFLLFRHEERHTAMHSQSSGIQAFSLRRPDLSITPRFRRKSPGSREYISPFPKALGSTKLAKHAKRKQVARQAVNKRVAVKR